jgi:hypothetical protein
MMMKPICPYCGEEMYDFKIYDGIQSTIMFTCHCDGYIEEEIEQAFKEAQECQTK